MESLERSYGFHKDVDICKHKVCSSNNNNNYNNIIIIIIIGTSHIIRKVLQCEAG
jgi:hypothetical protein